MIRDTVAQLDGQLFDVVVIGGGVTGAATARDAALRGLSVALIERVDIAAGTSSRSGRLIHGGIRYLGSLQLRLVRQACSERETMLRLAPHLCLPRPFLFLVYEGYEEALWKQRIGLTFYDLWSGNPSDRRHRILDQEALIGEEPAINRAGLRGAGVFYDFMTDDARLTIDLMHSAWDAGARVATHVAVTGGIIESGRLAGVMLEDQLGGQRGSIRARQVINTTGAWSDQVLASIDGASSEPPLVRPTKGAHIVFRATDVPIHHPLFFRFPRDRRIVWAIPSSDDERIYVGGTDTDYSESLDDVVADERDVEFLLGVANHIVPGRSLGPNQILSSWAGLRPLVRTGPSRAASAVSREHRIVRDPNGLITIVGGKLTTARLMGEEVVDVAVRGLGHDPRALPSRSHDHQISGAIDTAGRAAILRRAEQLGLDPIVPTRLLQRYGGNADRILDLVAASPDLGAPIDGHGVTRAEIRYAIREEVAATVADVLDRRLGLFQWTADGAIDLAPTVLTELADFQGGHVAQGAGETEAYLAAVNANRRGIVASARV
jgi:glycerol-3-phosphate dehydrogenase